jgi:colanic acid biosynthesis glycosyl transferase WcaI
LKFLLLNQTFYPDVASTAQHLADLAAALAARGHQVTVIASRRAYDDPKTLFAKRQTWQGVRILRVPSTGLGKNSKWRRAFDCATFIASCCSRAAFVPRQHVVIALSSPPLISLVGLGLARLWHCRFVYWVMDLNPDETLAAGWLPAGSLAAKILEWASRLTLRAAHQVFVLDRFMFQRILQKGVPPQHIRILPPWSHNPQVRFDATDRARFRRRHGLERKFVVMYSGNHSPCHPLDTVIAAARRLAGRESIVFCFIGGGTEFRRIQRLFDGACARASGNVLCLPYQPLSELSASLSAADLHLVVHGDDFVGIVHPCKIYNILSLGAPLVYIGPEDGPVPDVLSQANGDLLSASLRHGDVEGLVRRIEQLRNRSADFPRARLLPLATRFSKETILPRFIAELDTDRAPG